MLYGWPLTLSLRKYSTITLRILKSCLPANTYVLFQELFHLPKSLFLTLSLLAALLVVLLMVLDGFKTWDFFTLSVPNLLIFNASFSLRELDDCILLIYFLAPGVPEELDKYSDWSFQNDQSVCKSSLSPVLITWVLQVKKQLGDGSLLHLQLHLSLNIIDAMPSTGMTYTILCTSKYILIVGMYTSIFSDFFFCKEFHSTKRFRWKYHRDKVIRTFSRPICN